VFDIAATLKTCSLLMAVQYVCWSTHHQFEVSTKIYKYWTHSISKYWNWCIFTMHSIKPMV